MAAKRKSKRVWDSSDFKNAPDHKYSWFVVSGASVNSSPGMRRWWPSKWAAEQAAIDIIETAQLTNNTHGLVVAHGIVRVGPTSPPIGIIPL